MCMEMDLFYLPLFLEKGVCTSTLIFMLFSSLFIVMAAASSYVQDGSGNFSKRSAV